MTLAIAGLGAKFYRESGGSYEAIAEVKSISQSGTTRNTADATNFDSPDGYMESIGTTRDPGQYNLSLNFRYDEYVKLKADFESNVRVNYRIILDDSGDTQFDFEGLVTEIPLDFPMDDVVTLAVVIKISGPVTVT